MAGFKVSGAGHANNATKCFKVTFDEALSTPPTIEGWDNSQAYPARDSAGSTTDKEIFTGTDGNNHRPMMAAYSGGEESSAIPPGENWHPDSPDENNGYVNLLKGTTYFVTCRNTPGAGGNTVFNLSLRVPYDATVPSTSSMNALIQIRYTYTGDPPSPVFSANQGTESEPSWTNFTPGTQGIRFCNSGTQEGVYKLTLPETGQVYAGEVWVTTD